MFLKAQYFRDHDAASKIHKCRNPSMAKKIGREVNYAIFSEEEFNFRKTRRDPFVMDVLYGSRVMVIGSEVEFVERRIMGENGQNGAVVIRAIMHEERLRAARLAIHVNTRLCRLVIAAPPLPPVGLIKRADSTRHQTFLMRHEAFWWSLIFPGPDHAPSSPALTRDLLCPRCGYNLRGLHEYRCPECESVKVKHWSGGVKADSYPTEQSGRGKA